MKKGAVNCYMWLSLFKQILVTRVFADINKFAPAHLDVPYKLNAIDPLGLQSTFIVLQSKTQ